MKIILTFLTNLAAIIAIACFLFGYSSLSDLPIEGRVIIIVVLIVIVFLTSYLILHDEKQRRQKSAYVSAIPKVSKAVSEFVNSYSDNDFITILKVFVNEIAVIFTEIKGVKCCVTVKYFDAEGVMKTERSTVTSIEPRDDRAELIKKKEYPTIESFIKANTDFKLIFKNLEKMEARSVFFHSDDLIDYPYYHNALLEEDRYYDKLAKKGSKITKRDKITLWPLAYRSTIVVPLCRMLQKENKRLAGTLCIDSPNSKTFNLDADLSLIQTISETIFLYMDINKRKRLKKRDEIRRRRR